MNNDLISIIVPCYNAEKYIKKCIETIKNQTYKNLEVLLINDGSKDNTEKIIKKETSKDKRFKYYYKENGGLSDARNYGLDKFTGEYICFIDSDDYIEPNFIEELYNCIKNNNCKISVCGLKRVYEDKVTYDKINKDVVNTCIIPAAWNKMFHKSLFLDTNIKFPFKKWYEDLCAISKVIFFSNGSYAVVDKPLYNYTQNNSSIMHTYDDRIFDIFYVIDDLEDFLKKNNIYDKYKENIEFINIYHILIGTIYRSSFHKDFSKELIKDIIEKVEKKYPNWKNNKYLKKQSFVYKMYLKLVQYKMCALLYFLLKHFAKYLYL